MKKLLLLSFVLISVLIIGCDPDTPEPTTTTLTLNFDSKYGDNDFAAFQYYDHENGDSIYLNVAHFFITNITLLNGNEETPLKDVDVLNFANQAAGSEPEQIVIEDVAKGNYTGIRFGLGVDALQNDTRPADYAQGEPLANASEYWDWRETYIFGKFEGRFKEANGTETFYTYHPGTDDLYRTKSFNKTITLSGGVATDLDFTIDFEALFKQDNGKIDVKNNSVSHTGQDDLWLATLIMDNLENSINVE